MPIDLIGAGIGAIGSLIGGAVGSDASSTAAAQQAAAQQQVITQANQAVTAGQAGVTAGAANANQTLAGSAQQQVGMYSPYTQAGTSALGGVGQYQAAGQAALPSLAQMAGPSGQLAQQFSFNPSNLQNDPGYAFTLQQGQQAIQKAAAAQGGLFSSGTAKSLAGYTEGTANQYYQQAYNNAANTFNINRQGALSQAGILQGLSGQGLTAGQSLTGQGLSATQGSAGAVGATSSQMAGNTYNQGVVNSATGMQGAQIVGNALTNQGNAQAAGTMGSANAWNSAIGGVSNQAMGVNWGNMVGVGNGVSGSNKTPS